MPARRREPLSAKAPPIDWRETVQLGPNAPPVRRVPAPLARRFYQLCVAMVAEAVGDADLTALQFAVLPYLSKQTGEPGMDQNGLAARIGIDRNNVSLLLKQLEAKGLVERQVNGDDRRARLLQLTPKGEKLFQRVAPATLAANDRILAPLAPHERDLFLDLLVRVIKGNFVHARPGAGRRKRSFRPFNSNQP
jgi:MarR family transcriptional regulator, lower aerobic nicotinate degradation pathway regulator